MGVARSARPASRAIDREERVNRRGAWEPFDEAKPERVRNRGREKEETGEPPARSRAPVVLAQRCAHAFPKSPANYCALRVVEETYGHEHMRRLLGMWGLL
jgi:hypothetical protein